MRGEEAEKARVTAYVEHALEELGVTWTDITLKWTTSNVEDRVACETVPDWEYRQASMLWNLSTTSVMSDQELWRTVVHEVVHVLVAPMESLVECSDGSTKSRVCELAVENVARAILRVLPEEEEGT